MQEYNERNIEAPFNMAVATLMRLDAILQQIRNIDFIYPNDSPEKQKAHIGLVKQFFINATPLMNDTEVDKYKKEILEMNTTKQMQIKSGSQIYKCHFDLKIDYRLNEILIELQQNIKRFFMPPTKDPKRAVVNF